MRTKLLALVLAPLLAIGAGACSRDDARSAEGGGAVEADTEVFDAKAMLNPGTKGLVVTNPFGNRPTYFSFEKVPYGANPKHSFFVRNDEGRDVTLLDVAPSCGCIEAIVRYTDAKGEVHAGARAGSPVLVVPAGATFELACSIDTTVEVQPNLQKLVLVRVRSDSPSVPYMTFELNLIVERTFRAVPGVLDLGRIAQSAGKSARTDVSTALKGVQAKILGLDAIEGPFTATVDASEMGDEPFWIVVATAPPNLPLGPVRGALRLSTSGEDGTGTGNAFEIPVTGTVVQDLVAEPSALAFGSYPVGTAKRAEIVLGTLVPGERFAFLGAEVEGDHVRKLALERTPRDPDEKGRAQSWSIALVAPSDLPFGQFAGVVTIKTDHPRVPSFRVPYSGNAK